MALRGLRCLALVLFGDILPPVSLPRLVAALLPTATERVGPVHIFVAGDEAADAPSSPPATDDILATSLARGRELQRKGYLEEAADVLECVLASRHDEPGALLHLGEVRAQLGKPRQAASLADRLLSLDRLDLESRSFMLNRRGTYLKLAEDWIGARQSFELALEEHGQGINRHALRNLAALLHFQILPSETAGSGFSTLERAIDLYRAALGRNDVLSTGTQRSNLSDPGETHDDGAIGGPVDRPSIFSDLAAALLLAGRPREAVAELELALEETLTDVGSSGSGSSEVYGKSGTGGDSQAVDITTVGTAAEDMSRRTTAFLWDSLSRAKMAAGDVSGAAAAGKMALNLVDDEPRLYYSLAVRLQKVGLLTEAQDMCLAAVALDPTFTPALNALGYLEGARGNIRRAREYYEASLAATRSSMGTRDEELTSMFLVATAVVPTLYQSNDHIAEVRHDFGRSLDRLLAEPMDVSSTGVEQPSATIGSGGLGYYILYQGFEDLEIRRKLARAYWKFAPSLRYCAPFLASVSFGWGGEQHDVNEAYEVGTQAPSEHMDLSGESLDSLNSETSKQRQQSMAPPQEEKILMPQTEVVRAEDDPGVLLSNNQNNMPTSCRQQRVRVGFLSAFFYHHSVGLLVEGVMTRLDRRRFETTAIFLQPHPTSSTESNGGGDDVYNAVRARTEHVLDVSANSLAACRHAIASLQLDVLVFTEIGMNFESYFLSFARLAQRSALFWGHAVTSGVTAFDGTGDLGYAARAEKDNSFAGFRQKSDGLGHASGGGADRSSDIANPNEVGGVDYFISSWLFEDKMLGRLAQRKYSESLYLMEGLTTRFGRPVPPKPGLVTRETLGIPHRPTTSSDDQRSCGALYVVPQNLFKLHPDFDRLVVGVLSADPSGCVVFIRASEASMTEGLVQRMSRTVLSAGVAPERIVFIPRVGQSQFLSFVELADVVLDPFPVGGGRSSLEIFAVGTPIIMLYNRTSILQLTYGMYATMGLDGTIGNVSSSNAPVSLVTYDEDHFIRNAVAVATDAMLNARSRELILANNHRLYEQDAVVAEWEDFLEGIISVPRPPPTERQNGLAVDASNFPLKRPWCSNKTDNSEVEDSGGVHPHSDDVPSPFQAVPHEDTSAIRRALVEATGEPRVSAAESYTNNEEDNGVDEIVNTRSTPSTELSELSAPPAWAEMTGLGVHPDQKKPFEMKDRPQEVEATGLAASSEIHRQTGHVNAQDAVQDPASGRQELLYAIDISPESPSSGSQPSLMLAELYAGSDPMEEARRIIGLMGLDNIQYRWVGAILCRGIRRLERPVVFSTQVKIADGPSLPLEVHQGDDLYQVAHWHCHRYSVGAEFLSALNERLEKALPQHADPEWISSRAEDRSCSTSSSPPITADGTTDHSPINLESENIEPVGGSTKEASVAASGTPEERHEGHRDGGDRDGGFDGVWNLHKMDDGACVTLAITTCKRLELFLGTAEGLQDLLGPLPQSNASGAATPRVCHVLVVDDGSSPEDRGVMLSSFPHFTYYFKGPGDVKGHAASMNLILSLTKTRYLLYMEDDWWVLRDNPLPPLSGVGNVLWRAMEVLQRSTERVSQVLLNDQSTKYCAWGITASCTPEMQGTASGWPRVTVGLLPSQEHNRWPEGPPNKTLSTAGECGDDGMYRHSKRHAHTAAVAIDCGKERTQTPSEDHSTDSGSRPVENNRGTEATRVEYRLHEFGLVSPLHGLSYWPGFTLNPALWDLARLRDSYRRQYGRMFEFDPEDIRFEQSVSVELLDAGVTVAHLPDVTFKHVGGDRSAYKANDMRRPWDTT